MQFFELINNSLCSKVIENVRNIVDARLVTDAKEYKNQYIYIYIYLYIIYILYIYTFLPCFDDIQYILGDEVDALA